MLHITLVIHYTSLFVAKEIARRCWTPGVEGDASAVTRPDATPLLASLDTESEEDNDEPYADETCEPRPATPGTSPSPDSVDAGLSPRPVHSREANDPERVFGSLFTDDGRFNFALLAEKTAGRTLKEVAGWCDVDHYNLLEKAVIYNSRTLVRLLLSLDGRSGGRRSVFDRAPIGRREAAEPFRGAVHLAAFLGCVDIVEEFLGHNPAVSVLRGPVHIRPVHGPPNDLFRIIGYSDFTENPRLAFQMKWLRSHPNELPVHYSICGGYPLVMKMLIACEPPDEPAEPPSGGVGGGGGPERDALPANLVRQAASCASYSCLEALCDQIPDALHARDRHGRLYVAGGFAHGLRFVRFLMERGFAIKLLNNVDGAGTLNALHVFYQSLGRPDGTAAKYTELYDVTELLLDLSVDVNMETTALKSHDVSDTPLHVLIDHVNLALSGAGLRDGPRRDAAPLADVQEIYDGSVRDAVRLLLENGFDLERHRYSLLKRLFMNRNFVRRYSASADERHLVRANYGLRHVYDTAALLLEASPIRLCPARREITPALYLIDALREPAAVQCAFGDRRAARTFNGCLRLLFESGDGVDVYPFPSSEESYMASPLLHLCDVYVRHWCGRRADRRLVPTAANFLEALGTLCDRGARFTCYMHAGGAFYKHGVYDCVRGLFVAVQRHLADDDDDDDDERSMNLARLDLVSGMSSVLAQYGADPEIQEYAFRKGHVAVARKATETKVLGQVLLVGLYSAANDAAASQPLTESEEYRKACAIHFNLASHVTYYACLQDALSLSDDLGLDRSGELLRRFRTRAENARRLVHIARLRIYDAIKPEVKTGHRRLPLPPTMLNYVLNFER